MLNIKCCECATTYDAAFVSCPNCGCPSPQSKLPYANKQSSCPECGNELPQNILSQACPNCGFPLPPSAPLQQVKRKYKPSKVILWIGLTCLAIILICAVALKDRFLPDYSEKQASGEPFKNEDKLKLYHIAKKSTYLVGVINGNQNAQGSAVAFAKYGNCLLAFTNNHVVEGLKGNTYGTTSIILCPYFERMEKPAPLQVYHVLNSGFKKKNIDLAIMLFHVNTDYGLPYAPLAKVPAKKGEWVYSIGNPRDETWLASEGHVLYTQSQDNIVNIANDIVGAPGASGSGLFNRFGHLVGVVYGVTDRRGQADPGIPDRVYAIDVVDAQQHFEIKYLVVDSRGDWQNSGVVCNKGDCVSIAAVGTWKIGSWLGAGSCDASGIAGYDNDSHDRKYRHGSLLVKDDGPDIPVYQNADATSDGGMLKFRINDKDQGNNEGIIEVIIVRWK